MKIPIQIKRFFKYSASGVSAFLFDLFLLFVFVEFINMNYLISVSAAFFIATSTNYTFNRKWSFKESKESLKKSYANFLLIAIFGIGITTFSVGFLVQAFDFYYLFARIFIAGFVGIFNFFMNYRFTFGMKEELKSSFLEF